eukprot:1186709-Prorocentrum_minimum.AAC.3
MLRAERARGQQRRPESELGGLRNPYIQWAASRLPCSSWLTLRPDMRTPVAIWWSNPSLRTRRHSDHLRPSAVDVRGTKVDVRGTKVDGRGTNVDGRGINVDQRSESLFSVCCGVASGELGAFRNISVAQLMETFDGTHSSVNRPKPPIVNYSPPTVNRPKPPVVNYSPPTVNQPKPPQPLDIGLSNGLVVADVFACAMFTPQLKNLQDGNVIFYKVKENTRLEKVMQSDKYGWSMLWRQLSAEDERAHAKLDGSRWAIKFY